MKPNIVFIICHDLGKRLSCYGVPNVHSPNLDRLASEGVIFHNNFATAPQCSPSRSSIMTGRFPHSSGCMGLANGIPPFADWTLPPDARTIPRILREHGYKTHLFGLQHEARDSASLGYEYVHETTSEEKIHNLCRDVTQDFITFLKNAQREPFFASVGYF